MSRCWKWFLMMSVLTAPAAVLTTARAGPVGGEYRADSPFPEFMPMWREGWAWFDENGERVRYAHDGMPLGGYLFATFRNGTNQSLRVKDVLLEGVSLARGVAPEHPPKGIPDDKYPSSLQFSKLPSADVDKLIAAGEPVWWKVEPREIPPGGFGQVTVRLRRQPRVKTLTMSVPALAAEDGQAVAVVDRRQPWFFSINFSPAFDTVHVYLRHPSGKGIAPQRMFIDGQDVTAGCRIVADPAVDTVPVIIRPEKPFVAGRWYLFQADYADGLSARVSIGAWQPGLTYGMWGYSKRATEEENRKFYLEDMRLHHINTLLHSVPGEVRQFLRTPEGREYSKTHDLRAMSTWLNDSADPPFYFLTDEPDAGDFMSKMLDPNKRIGSLAQWLVDRMDMIRREDTSVPILLNVDNTFKPENWYTYAQLADIPCADPYYQEAMQSDYKSDPTNLGAYLKPTYVYGVGTVYQSAGAPKPMHLILHTCRFDFTPDSFPFRGPTPEEKRVEVYYALAAGAKALSFWWYTPFGEYYGCGGDTPDMKALWREIGLLGAEIRSAESVILRSSPASVVTKGPRTLWLRTLISGDDTLALIVVNDNLASDRLGTVVRPVEKAKVEVQVPTWLEPADVFEVTWEGTRDVAHQLEGDGLTVHLGRVNVSRFVLITADKGLRRQVQERYDKRCAANVRVLKSS